MECQKCHFKNPDDTRFCGNCAAPLNLHEDIYSSPTETLQTPMKELTRGSTFARRFEVIEELGRGGMGGIYRVFDKKIGEEVALKLINPEIAADKKTIKRFNNELKMARKISHRNVCQMYDLSEEEGKHYITMEYVPGESLKSMIGMMGQLSAGQVILLTKQVCEGLAEAHKLGVVHRDLKPQNIMVDREGHVRIMDFGIARSLKEKGITDAGAMIGTPEYMSPEQVEGKEADQRSDIYSLGTVLFEMLTGRLPFEGHCSLSIALKHKTEIPPDPRQFNPQVPLELSRVILRCLEKDKERRYKKVEELLFELNKIEEEISPAEREIPEGRPITLKRLAIAVRRRWAMIAVLFVVVVMAAIANLYFKGENPVPLPGGKMLVVLPFENLGPPEDEYFADGMTEEITSRLAALQGLSVISRTSAFKYKNTKNTIKRIGEELGVDYVLEGAVRWDRSNGGKGRVRITPQLIRVSDDTHLWSEKYDLVIEDIFLVQSEVAEEVARQLDLTVLEPERNTLKAKPTNNFEAYDYYLRGKEHEYKGWLYSDAQEFEHAVEMYEKATQLDAKFALAYVNLSLIHSRMHFFGVGRSEERLAKSKAAVDRALELQPALPDAQLALAFYYYWGLLDYDRALGIFESVQKAQPNISPELLGYIQRRQGKWKQSLVTLEKAFKLNPRYSQLAYEIGLSYMRVHRYEQAEEWFDRALSINPERLSPQLGKVGISVLLNGNIKEARALLRTLPQHHLTDYMWLTLGMLGRNYKEVLDRLASLSYDSFEEQHFFFQKNLAFASVYYAGNVLSLMKAHAESARIVLEKALKEHSGDPRYHAALGLAYAYLGRKDDAIREGNRAVELYPVSKDAASGPPFVLNLARIYAIVGEHDKAIGKLEYLLSIPTAEFLWEHVSVSYLRLDPQLDSLSEKSRFQRLLRRGIKIKGTP